MSKNLVEIEGFSELEKKLRQLPDRVKKREVLKILGQVANPTIKAARNLAPVSKKPHLQSGRRSSKIIQPGTGRRSIGKTNMRRAKNPIVIVSPKSRKSVDGWYLRRFVIPGTKKQESNPFMDKAYEQTKGRVTKDAEVKVVKYIQKQINRLSNA